MKTTPGCYYTVRTGRFKGITGVAIDPITPHGNTCDIYSIDFPGDGIISFFGLASQELRRANRDEELNYRRRVCD